MKVIFFGTPEFAVPSLARFLTTPGFEVLAVVTQPDKRRGRGNDLIPSPVKILATEHNIPVWQPPRIKKDPETLERLSMSGADVFVVVAYGQILSQEILDMPRLGCVNGHGSILPQYRGAAPIQWCLYHGETETGITAMLMDAGMDTGPMLLKATTPIALLQTAPELMAVLADITASLLIETLPKLETGELQPIPQDNALATYAPLIKKPDYCLDWTRPAIALHNQIRAFFPNCVAGFRGMVLKVRATAPLGASYWNQLPPDLQRLEKEIASVAMETTQPGMIVGVVKNVGPIVQTGEGVLLLRELQQAGKRVQSGWDFANGTRLEVGEILEDGLIEE
ncbi:MAG: methionyl-tRNA formyltransferase [Leptolyngbyaceae cyanobacterium bins.59]|nr:methionyl-tRNA formyltransferase [Leptolyngbyaceae cyanobacterium bins.59]